MPNSKTWIDYDFAPEPRQIQDIYDSGFRGVRIDTATAAGLARYAGTFYDAFPAAQGRGQGKLSLPYRYALELEPQFGRYEAQTTGDCVSHGTRNAGMIDYCADAYFGETKYKGRFATENIYGWRGHGGQGASCGKLCSYVSDAGPGGFLVRQRYDSGGGKSVDLSKYKSSLGHNWGRGGTPSWLNQIANENPAARTPRVRSLEEARDAIAAGFGLNVCSGKGFSNRRNEHGLCEQRGSWAHAMAWVAVDDTPWAHEQYGGPLFCVQNSWGQWNSGPKRHDQPDGSFWIRPRVAQSMIGGAYAVMSVRGYDRELVYDRIDKIAA